MKRNNVQHPPSDSLDYFNTQVQAKILLEYLKSAMQQKEY